MRVVHQLDETRIAQLHEFFAREWWTSDRSLEETRRCVAGSQIRIGLTDDRGDLVGFARVITDYTFKALVFDVIVACAHRGKGLGEYLIKLVLEHPDLARVRHFELYCLPDVEPFYQRYGFSTEVGGVRLMRRDGAAEGVARQGAAASPESRDRPVRARYSRARSRMSERR